MKFHGTDRCTYEGDFSVWTGNCGSQWTNPPVTANAAPSDRTL